MVADLADSRGRERNFLQQMLWTPRGPHLLHVRVQALRTATSAPVTGGPELADSVSSARGHPHRALHWVPGRRNPSPSTIDRGSSSPEPATARASSILRILSSVAFAGRKM